MSCRARFIAAVAILLLCAQPSSPQCITQSGSPDHKVTIPDCRVGIGPNATSPESALHLAGPNGVNALTATTPASTDPNVTGQKFRLQTIPGIAAWAALTLNSNYNGSAWILDNPNQNGWFFKLDGRGVNAGNILNGLWLYRIPSGANSHTDEYPTFGVTQGHTYLKDRLGINLDTPNTVPDANLHVKGTGHITGDLVVDGNIAARFQDVAEWVPSRHDLPPGTVVVLDRVDPNTIVASFSPYDTTVAGVVSTRPGLILGEAAPSREQIATTGRVRVNVDASEHPIRIGDLLVTSSRAGYAMRSIPLTLDGTAIHRPGTIVGKALQPLPSGTGEILVLLSLQ
jgi:hypothetical protein